MAHVLMMPARATMTVDQALDTVRIMEPDCVICIGYENAEAGEGFYVRTSRMSRQDALWMAEQLRAWALDCGEVSK